jgi:hypothetical protein
MVSCGWLTSPIVSIPTRDVSQGTAKKAALALVKNAAKVAKVKNEDIAVEDNARQDADEEIVSGYGTWAVRRLGETTLAIETDKLDAPHLLTGQMDAARELLESIDGAYEDLPDEGDIDDRASPQGVRAGQWGGDPEDDGSLPEAAHADSPPPQRASIAARPLGTWETGCDTIGEACTATGGRFDGEMIFFAWICGCTTDIDSTMPHFVRTGISKGTAQALTDCCLALCNFDH